MEIQQDWEGTNLEDYLLEARWQPHRAMYLLAGYLVPNNILAEDYECVAVQQLKRCGRLSTFWHDERQGLRSFYDDPHSPSYFIDWALTKRYRPDWLDWAIERGLYEPNPVAGSTQPTELSAPYGAGSPAAPRTGTTPQKIAAIELDDKPIPHESASSASNMPDASNTSATYPRLETVTRPTVTTAEAAFYLNRSPQTLRVWASLENGPLRPVRISGKLAWSVLSIKKLLNGDPAQ